MPQSDWTDWIEHDGSGMPNLPMGTIVERRFDRRVGWHSPVAEARGSLYCTAPLSPSEWHSWAGMPHVCHVIRYRWKRPTQLRRLSEIAEHPARTPEPA